MHFSSSITFVHRTQQNHTISSMNTCISSHNMFCSALHYGLSSFQVHAFKNYSFPLLSILKFGPHSVLFSSLFLVKFFLNSWCKNPRPFTWGFLLPFGPKVTRIRGERFWLIPYNFK